MIEKASALLQEAKSTELQSIAFLSEDKAQRLKDSGVEIVHLSSCLRGKSDDYEQLAKRLSQDFAVVGYTHGAFIGRTRQAICIATQENDDDGFNL